MERMRLYTTGGLRRSSQFRYNTVLFGLSRHKFSASVRMADAGIAGIREFKK